MREDSKKVFDYCSGMYPAEDKHWESFFDIFSAIVKTNKKYRILDAGCGPGLHLKHLNKITNTRSKLFGLDFSRKMLEIAFLNNKYENNTKIELIHGDILDIPFKNQSFEIIICLNNTLGNIVNGSINTLKSERQKILNKFYNLLSKDDGILMISVYNKSNLKINNYGDVFILEKEKSRIKEGDLVVRFNKPISRKKEYLYYYSHWFNEREVLHALKSAGFNSMKLLKRKSSMFIIALK